MSIHLAKSSSQKKLEPEIDYYFNDKGQMVFTRNFHLKRGHCCGSGCLHCPFKDAFDPQCPIELQMHSADANKEESLQELAEKYMYQMEEKE
jgi:flavoprotein